MRKEKERERDELEKLSETTEIERRTCSLAIDLYLRLSSRSLTQVWFSNRRAKWRREEKLRTQRRDNPQHQQSQQQQQQRTEDALGSRSAGAALPASSTVLISRRGGYGGARRSSSGLELAQSPSATAPTAIASATAAAAVLPFATQQQMDSLDGHLKRSALSLEILVYDVLLSKPVCNSGSAMGEGVLLTSPCTHSAVLSTSPENHPSFPSCPPGGNSPITSPGAGVSLPSSSRVQIVTRAQYSTPRTPQPPSVSTDVNQQQQPDVSNTRTRERRTPSPGLTHRGSNFCGSNSTGFQQQPSTNNEYDYHILLRSLFHHEPYYRTFSTSEKKR